LRPSPVRRASNEASSWPIERLPDHGDFLYEPKWDGFRSVVVREADGVRILSWEPLRIERVCEVKYDHLQGNRFRHGTTFLRWRADKPPSDCTYEQLEVTPPYELARVFGA
jgi:ATP-dependent DNA ligase